MLRRFIPILICPLLLRAQPSIPSGQSVCYAADTGVTVSRSLPSAISAGSLVIAEVNAGSMSPNNISFQPLLSDDAADNCQFAIGPVEYRVGGSNSRQTLACINTTAGARTFSLTSQGGGSQTYNWCLTEVASASTTQPIAGAVMARVDTTNHIPLPYFLGTASSVALPAGSYLLYVSVFDPATGNTYNANAGWTANFQATGTSGMRAIISKQVTNPGSMSYTAAPVSGTISSNAHGTLLAITTSASTANRETQHMVLGSEPATGSAIGQTDYPLQAGDLGLVCQESGGGPSAIPTSTLRSGWNGSPGWGLVAGYISITAWSITSNVVTFTTKPNTLVSGNVVQIGGSTTGGFPTSTFFNGQTFTVLSSGLTSTQFKVNFTHANGSATENGTAYNGFQCYATSYAQNGFDQLTVYNPDQASLYHAFHGFNTLGQAAWTDCGSVTTCADPGIITTVPNSYIDSFALLGHSQAAASQGASYVWNTNSPAHDFNTDAAFIPGTNAAGTYTNTWNPFGGAGPISVAIFSIFPNPAVTLAGGKLSGGGTLKAQ